ETLRLVARAEWNRAILRRKIEKRDHAHTRHHISAPGRIGVGDEGEIAVDGRRDIDRLRTYAERVDHELCMLEACRTRRPIRHSHAEDVLRPERARGEIRSHRGVYAAGHPYYGRMESALSHLLANELGEPVRGELG